MIKKAAPSISQEDLALDFVLPTLLFAVAGGNDLGGAWMRRGWRDEMQFVKGARVPVGQEHQQPS